MFRGLSYKKTGDILEVRLRDENYHPYFIKKARISDEKQMKELMDELREKGINFPVNWLL